MGATDNRKKRTTASNNDTNGPNKRQGSRVLSQETRRRDIDENVSIRPSTSVSYNVNFEM